MIENERTKLTANALSSLGTAVLVSGIIGPAIGFLYGNPAPSTHGWWFMVGLVWFLGGIVLHLIARAWLGRLKT